jgi:hypothetical protein
MLNLTCDILLSTSAFKLNMRRYTKARSRKVAALVELGYGQGLTLVHLSAHPEPFLSVKPAQPRNVSLK